MIKSVSRLFPTFPHVDQFFLFGCLIRFLHLLVRGNIMCGRRSQNHKLPLSAYQTTACRPHHLLQHMPYPARQKRIVDTQSEAATTKSLCGVHPLSSQQTNSGATNICISGATESLCQLNYGTGLSLGFVNAKYRVALDFSLESFGLFLGSQL
jgi:hypothetical protein